jgi:8-oxo-dGTP pyrophosphatase MutT (NUDIX family)
MMHIFKAAWSEMIRPIWHRPKRAQVAAVCYRQTTDGKEVLLITSRDTGRWIVPKGWPIDGLDGAGAARVEAWEEAGVKHADMTSEPIGFYDYDKGMRGGETVPVEASVYLAEVTDLSADYPEAGQRTRKWFAPTEAADLVAEPELKAILRAL